MIFNLNQKIDWKVDDWGDDQWLRDRADRLNNADAVSVGEAFMVHLTLEDAYVAKCKEWAAAAIK